MLGHRRGSSTHVHVLQWREELTGGQRCGTTPGLASSPGRRWSCGSNACIPCWRTPVPLHSWFQLSAGAPCGRQRGGSCNWVCHPHVAALGCSLLQHLGNGPAARSAVCLLRQTKHAALPGGGERHGAASSSNPPACAAKKEAWAEAQLAKASNASVLNEST